MHKLSSRKSAKNAGFIPFTPSRTSGRSDRTPRKLSASVVMVASTARSVSSGDVWLAAAKQGCAHTTRAKRQLLDSLKDREYRSSFVCERVRSSVALQIRALREQRKKMTQAQLGDHIGMAQTWVSKLENPDYGKMTVATLLRLATDAFDTDLEIKFRPFSETISSLP